MNIKILLKFIFIFYLLLLSISLIKHSSLALSPAFESYIDNINSEPKLFALGWLAASIIQSASIIVAICAAFVSINSLSLYQSVFILIGASVGATITALLISILLKAEKRKDFRHGFEIGLTNAIYHLFLGGIVFLLEFYFKLFSGFGGFMSTLISKVEFLNNIPRILELITDWFISLLTVNDIYVFILGIVFLILSLRVISKLLLNAIGEGYLQKYIKKYFNNTKTSFLTGLILTSVLLSTNITITLLVPLAIYRLINLWKAIPFILGANIGTITDTLIVVLAVGKPEAIALVFILLAIRLLGAIIFLKFPEFLFNITKYISKTKLHLSRKIAVFILILFLILPLLIIFL